MRIIFVFILLFFVGNVYAQPYIFLAPGEPLPTSLEGCETRVFEATVNMIVRRSPFQKSPRTGAVISVGESFTACINKAVLRDYAWVLHDKGGWSAIINTKVKGEPLQPTPNDQPIPNDQLSIDNYCHIDRECHTHADFVRGWCAYAIDTQSGEVQPSETVDTCVSRILNQPVALSSVARSTSVAQDETDRSLQRSGEVKTDGQWCLVCDIGNGIGYSASLGYRCETERDRRNENGDNCACIWDA